ncbi:MAG: D-2-hydroxyacid dehydrogenase [Gemmatimonadota bacterium]
MKVLAYFPFSEERLSQLSTLAARCGDHVVVTARTEEEAVAMAPGCEALLGYFTPAVCAAAPQLKWIQSFSAGMDKFLFPEIVERDVVITNMAGKYASQGGEHAWALLLGLSRGIATAARRQERRQWRGAAATELAGGTLGIIGLGGFGRETARRAQGYSMTVLALDPACGEPPAEVEAVRAPTRQNLLDLLRQADAVVVACPLTAQTHHLIGREELAAMKPTAYLVSVSRGGIIDEAALAAALAAGQIAGAGLDVCEVEPLPADSPLWECANLILTPHQAGASQHRERVTFEFFAANLERYLRGQPLLNVIDKQRGY